MIMKISVDPSAFRNQSYQTNTPKICTFDELQQLKKEPTKVMVEGDIYHSSATYFKQLTINELQHEKFTVDTSKHKNITYSDGSTDDIKQLVAIRNPSGTGEVLTFDLSKKTIDNLKEKFGDDNNFFERNDGVLRLNGEAENFVAGWMQNIRENRNYDKADADRNGKIEGDEAQALTIAFERQTDYDYLGKKLVQINAVMGANYQSLGRSADAHHLFETDKEKTQSEAAGYTYKRNAITSQYTKFEKTVEKELDHTLQMDANLDGTVTLDEGLSDEFAPNYHQKIIDDMKEFHEDLLEDHPDLNDDTRLQNHNIGLYDIISKDEEKAQQEVFRKQALYLKEQLAQDPFFLSGMGTIDILDAKNNKTQLPASHEGQMGYTAATATANEQDTNNAKISTYG